MPILVTGAAGFIGYHLSHRLLEEGRPVLGVDNLNSYYDVQLKKDRIKRLTAFPDFTFQVIDLMDRSGMARLFAENNFDLVVNLAAQAGVRGSLSKPHAYVDSNIVGFLNVLEGCRYQRVKHLVFASSSSVYGLNTGMPFSIHANVDHPTSLYAATKKANELMAHSYSHLFGLPVTGLRFFTVYGPWGRPDMALFLFTKAILNGRTIQVFNQGDMKRDFTYIDDIIEGVSRILDSIPEPNPSWDGHIPDPGSSPAPYRLYNIGHNQPVRLMDFIETIENLLGRKARKEFLPLQPGDIPATCADVTDLEEAVGYRPTTSVPTGIARFIDWYKDYYRPEGL